MEYTMDDLIIILALTLVSIIIIILAGVVMICIIGGILYLTRTRISRVDVLNVMQGREWRTKSQILYSLNDLKGVEARSSNQVNMQDLLKELNGLEKLNYIEKTFKACSSVNLTAWGNLFGGTSLYHYKLTTEGEEHAKLLRS